MWTLSGSPRHSRWTSTCTTTTGRSRRRTRTTTRSSCAVSCERFETCGPKATSRAFAPCWTWRSGATLLELRTSISTLRRSMAPRSSSRNSCKKVSRNLARPLRGHAHVERSHSRDESRVCFVLAGGSLVRRREGTLLPPLQQELWRDRALPQWRRELRLLCVNPCASTAPLELT